MPRKRKTRPSNVPSDRPEKVQKGPLKLFQLFQCVHTDPGDFSSAVVPAPSEEAAKKIYPSGAPYEEWISEECLSLAWCNPEDVQCKELGIASKGVEAGIICASMFDSTGGILFG